MECGGEVIGCAWGFGFGVVHEGVFGCEDGGDAAVGEVFAEVVHDARYFAYFGHFGFLWEGGVGEEAEGSLLLEDRVRQRMS